MSVPVTRLGRVDESAKLGEGGYATVYRTDVRVSSYDGPLAYKEFLTTLTPDDHRQAVRDLSDAVRFRDGLSAAERADLDDRCAWPLESVTDGGRVVGGLMPLIRPEFFADVTPMATGRRTRAPRSLVRLSGDPASAYKAGYSDQQLQEFASPVLRLALVAQLAYTVAWLHKRDRVVGDISLNNAVFAVEPPRVVMLDCDGTAAQSDRQRSQPNTPFFSAPECLPPGSNPYARGNPTLQDTRTDVYKLGLCLIRGLAQGQGVVQAKTSRHLVGVYAPEVITLADRALSVNPDDRPTAAQFFATLSAHIAVLAPPPVIRGFRAIDTVVPRGADVVFEWDVANTSTLVLYTPAGAALSLDPRAGRCAVRADTSGVYTLEARRHGGSAMVESDLVRTFDLPHFDLFGSGVMQQVVPEIPSLPPTEFGSIRALPPRPSLELDSIRLPAIAVPSVEPFISGVGGSDSGLRAASVAGSPFTDVHHASGLGRDFADAGAAVRDLLSHAQDRLKVDLATTAAEHLSAAMKRIGDKIAARADKSKP